MTISFKNYKTPTKSEFKKMWNIALFVPDANVLLDLYRLPSSTSENLLKILKKLGAQLWIPHQVAKEFYQNRMEVIFTQEDAYREMDLLLEKSFKEFESIFDKKEFRHSFIDSNKIKEEIRDVFENNRKKIATAKKGHPNWTKRDSILKEFESLLKGKCGEPYTDEKLNEIFEEANNRYAKHIPPGYEDINKDYPNKYGDYIIWKQIINKAKSSKKPIILITRDNKSDWWLGKVGRNIGPRYVLREEFLKESGEIFYAYRSLNFIEIANLYLNIPVNSSFKDELKKIEKENLKEMEFTEETVSGINISEVPAGVFSGIDTSSIANTNPQQPKETRKSQEDNGQTIKKRGLK